MIGLPSLMDFLYIVDNNLLLNNPIAREDVANAEDAFGSSLCCLQGKTTQKSGPVRVQLPTLIPPETCERLHNVTLAVDIMFVNAVPFLVTMSKGVRFITTECLPDRRSDTVLAALLRVKRICNLRHFRVGLALADPEFESLRADLSAEQIHLETVSDDEHVPEAERCIRTTKERCRAIWSGLPFQAVPARMMIELVLGCVTWLNTFPQNNGVSPVVSPRALVTGIRVDYNRHCQIEAEAHTQTHEEHSNNMTQRTIGAIALRPTGNVQGSHCFLNLQSGQRITRACWNELPMPQDVIDRIHVLARRSKAHRGLTFACGNGDEIAPDDDDYDSDDESTCAPPQCTHKMAATKTRTMTHPQMPTTTMMTLMTTASPMTTMTQMKMTISPRTRTVMPSPSQEWTHQTPTTTMTLMMTMPQSKETTMNRSKCPKTMATP